MTSEFKVELGTDCPVIFLTGEITGESKTGLKASWMQAQAKSPRSVILDFSDVEYINSSGIALLIDLSTQKHNGGPAVVFTSLRTKVKKVLEMVGLLNYIESYESAESALANIN